MVRTLRSLEDPETAADRQTASLAALAVTLGLVVGGLYLVQTLRSAAAVQDCLMTGQRFCSVIASN